MDIEALIPKAETLIHVRQKCPRGKIALEELWIECRRGRIPRVRSEISERLIKELGMSLAGVARLLGVSTSAISNILHRIGQVKGE